MNVTIKGDIEEAKSYENSTLEIGIVINVHFTVKTYA